MKALFEPKFLATMYAAQVFRAYVIGTLNEEDIKKREHHRFRNQLRRRVESLNVTVGYVSIVRKKRRQQRQMMVENEAKKKNRGENEDEPLAAAAAAEAEDPLIEFNLQDILEVDPSDFINAYLPNFQEENNFM